MVITPEPQSIRSCKNIQYGNGLATTLADLQISNNYLGYLTNFVLADGLLACIRKV